MPTFPATATGSAAVRQTWPRSSVTVVLPFVPVTATNRFGSRRQASSSSPTTARPSSRARAITAASARHPGALDDAARALEKLDPVRVQVNLHARLGEPRRPLGRARVAARDLRPARRQHPRRRLSRPGQADHQVWAVGEGRAGLQPIEFWYSV